MQLKYHMVTIEDLVPQEHFLRKLEHVLDMSFVQEETAHLYSRKYGRPSIDPVVMVKYLLVGFLYGIPSERQIEQRIQTDVALRWYLGLDLFDRVPDHSTISQLRRRKPSFRKVFRRLFEEVVRQCVEKGLVSGRLVVTDSTHTLFPRLGGGDFLLASCSCSFQSSALVYRMRLMPRLWPGSCRAAAAHSRLQYFCSDLTNVLNPSPHQPQTLSSLVCAMACK